jgi:DNA-directed RNA polymerase specialized sigma subunit
MNRLTWHDWRSATGPAKARLLTILATENEPLVQKFASRFLLAARCFPDPLRDDVFQAARIGLLKAINKWDPARGAFATIAWYEMRHEMQIVLKDVTPLTYPRDMIFAKSSEHEADTFLTKTGRAPEPGEVALTGFQARRPTHTPARFVSVREAEGQTDGEPEPEADIDRARDVAHLKLWLSKQTKRDQTEFWTGKREDLTARAKTFVDARRAARGRVA